MPLTLDPGAGDAIALDDLVEALETSDFDVRDEASFASLAPLLARLARNPQFLADLVVAELEDRCSGQMRGNAYGAQVFLLRPPTGRYVVRANFWPAREDAVVRASGTAAFFYDHAHDHNFSFLTVGYQGPGYWSDYYEYDTDIVGLPGEAAGLRFVERARLDPGKVLLYRARTDVHVQLPPDSLSVSLNILGFDRAQPWREQYRFDIARGTIAEGLTTAPSEALVTLAAHFGGAAGCALAAELVARHPAPRMRVTALAALASCASDAAARAAVFAGAVDDPDRYVAGHARRWLTATEQSAP